MELLKNKSRIIIFTVTLSSLASVDGADKPIWKLIYRICPFLMGYIWKTAFLNLGF